MARTAFLAAKKGFHPPLIDLYIAQCAHDHDKTLITQDRHFGHIARVLSFQFELW